MDRREVGPAAVFPSQSSPEQCKLKMRSVGSVWGCSSSRINVSFAPAGTAQQPPLILSHTHSALLGISSRKPGNKS